jgi:hypothetical protein
MATTFQRWHSMQRFHLEGNFLPEGNLGLWKEIWKEIGRKYCYKEGKEKEILSYAKNAVNAVLEHLGQDPRIPILNINLTKPRTQGIISQTLLSVGRKDPRAFLCVSRGEMQETVMESLFSPTAR